MTFTSGPPHVENRHSPLDGFGHEYRLGNLTAGGGGEGAQVIPLQVENIKPRLDHVQIN